MDRYKFRGKHVNGLLDVVNDGQWVYGYLSAPNYINSEELGGEMLVDPATVGQYTGKQDENKTDVYEHDIVMNFNYGHYYTVVWDDESAGFYLKPKLDEDWLNFGEFEELSSLGYVVVGNIHDNPELLEGEKH